MNRQYLKIALAIIFIFLLIPVSAQNPDNTEAYLITCSPGTESYSMYGHSAIRLHDTVSGLDAVYNWGVFDFSTPNFTYKFARGRLDYMLGVYSYKSFLQEYLYENRSVISQKINLSPDQLIKLLSLLDDNMKKENRFYRYDFFMDNCATRIRDILENVVGTDLVYPQEELDKTVTYRMRLDEYQKGKFSWLDVGIDFLLGSPADKPCGFRESMFLPDYLQSNLSEAKVRTENGSISLLGRREVILDFQIIYQPDFHSSGNPGLS
jgi:hypothetical protein